jgi:hypothetical protein
VDLRALAGANRRGVALAATALAAVAVAAAVAGRGCGGADQTPDGAVRAFAAAARAGDRETMLELLGPKTRRWLDEAAASGSRMVGGARGFRPIELIGVGPASGAARIAVRSEEGGVARVEVVDEQGNRSDLEVVEVDGRWRVELLDQLGGR